MPRFGPWRREFNVPLHALQSELNRLFDDFLTPTRDFTTGTPPVDLEPAEWTPAVDLTETADAYVVTADVPGVDPTSIDLSVTGNVLSLRGVKTASEKGDPGQLRERPTGVFHRQITLGGEVDFDAVNAEARHGVLTIRLPKRVSARPRTIPVQAS